MGDGEAPVAGGAIPRTPERASATHDLGPLGGFFKGGPDAATEMNGG
jgi:hypothetical protein